MQKADHLLDLIFSEGVDLESVMTCENMPQSDHFLVNVGLKIPAPFLLVNKLIYGLTDPMFCRICPGLLEYSVSSLNPRTRAFERLLT